MYRKKMRVFHQLEQWATHWWWVILCVIICFSVYEQRIKVQNKEWEFLKNQLVALQSEKELLKMEQEDLLLRLNSQGDPAWIELILMRVLGLVPDGYTKVSFFSETTHDKS